VRSRHEWKTPCCEQKQQFPRSSTVSCRNLLSVWFPQFAPNSETWLESKIVDHPWRREACGSLLSRRSTGEGRVALEEERATGGEGVRNSRGLRPDPSLSGQFEFEYFPCFWSHQDTGEQHELSDSLP